MDGADAWMDPLAVAIGREISDSLGADDSAWSTLALAAEVAEGMVRIAAYRYAESGPPIPTRPPGIYDLVRELHERSRAEGAEPWDVVRVTFARDTGSVELEFVPPSDTDRWRISPENLDRLPEALRPEPAVGRTDPGLRFAELAQEIAADILRIPELAHPTWDAFAMAAEVTDDSVAITAYRYLSDGPPISTEGPEDDDLFWELRDALRRPDGSTWDVAIVKLQRAGGGLAIDLKTGADAAPWRVVPENMDHLPESLRPRPEDFGD